MKTCPWRRQGGAAKPARGGDRVLAEVYPDLSGGKCMLSRQMTGAYYV